MSQSDICKVGDSVRFRGEAGLFLVEKCEWSQRSPGVWRFEIHALDRWTGRRLLRLATDVESVRKPVPVRSTAKFGLGESVVFGVRLYTVVEAEWSTEAGMWLYTIEVAGSRLTGICESFLSGAVRPSPAAPASGGYHVISRDDRKVYDYDTAVAKAKKLAETEMGRVDVCRAEPLRSFVKKTAVEEVTRNRDRD